MKIVLLIGLLMAVGTMSRSGFNSVCWNEMKISASYFSLINTLWDETHNLEENIQNMIYMLNHLQNAVRSCDIEINFQLKNSDENYIARTIDVLERLDIIETASAWNINHKSYPKIDKLVTNEPPTFDATADCTKGYEVLNTACKEFIEVYEKNGDMLKALGTLIHSYPYLFLDCRDITQPSFLVQP